MKPHVQLLAAVRLKDCIVVVSIHNEDNTQHISLIWTYNLWTEKWNKCQILKGKALSKRSTLFGVEIKSVLYMYDGCTNLWKLIPQTKGLFHKSVIHNDNQKEIPSPRDGLSVWEYRDKMWIYGGFGESPVGFFNDHGAFERRYWQESGFNNQLFSFDPPTEKWKNVECFGDVPSPRASAATAVIKDEVWLYGGSSATSYKYDLYKLNMHSLTWTQIDIDRPKVSHALFTVTTSNQLVLHGLSPSGQGILRPLETWILDTGSSKWKQFPVSEECTLICLYTATTGLNNDVIMVYNHSHSCKSENSILPVLLEPRSLQQLSMRIIHEYSGELPWESLPQTLICKLMGKLIR